LVGLLSRYVPLIHYFTIDAFSFFASALSIIRVRRETPHPPAQFPRLNLKDTLLAGHRLACSKPVVAYTLFSGAVAGSSWLFILPLGMTLLLRERFPTDVGALGFLISAYGIGNITSNLILTNFTFVRPERWMFSGRLVAGIGFVGLSASSTLNQMMVASAVAATGGPLTDLGFVNLIQSHFRGQDVARIFRYTMAVCNGCLLVVFLISPKLFAQFSVSAVIFASAILIFISGLAGFAFSKRS
jgi:MFS transporter, DHA3 family, macrolide efflux protein